MKTSLLASAITIFMASCSFAHADNLIDTRYCGSPTRNIDGTIIRSRMVVRKFQALHPCPSTGKTAGACPGWAINHTIPLACGGCDAVSNMDWMPNEIKNCAEPWCRDRWERKVYANNPPFSDTDNCVNTVVKWSK